jgi:hypothetical protein
VPLDEEVASSSTSRFPVRIAGEADVVTPQTPVSLASLGSPDEAASPGPVADDQSPLGDLEPAPSDADAPPRPTARLARGRRLTARPSVDWPGDSLDSD